MKGNCNKEALSNVRQLGHVDMDCSFLDLCACFHLGPLGTRDSQLWLLQLEVQSAKLLYHSDPRFDVRHDRSQCCKVLDEVVFKIAAAEGSLSKKSVSRQSDGLRRAPTSRPCFGTKCLQELVVCSSGKTLNLNEMKIVELGTNNTIRTLLEHHWDATWTLLGHRKRGPDEAHEKYHIKLPKTLWTAGVPGDTRPVSRQKCPFLPVFLKKDRNSLMSNI